MNLGASTNSGAWCCQAGSQAPHLAEHPEAVPAQNLGAPLWGGAGEDCARQDHMGGKRRGPQRSPGAELLLRMAAVSHRAEPCPWSPRAHFGDQSQGNHLRSRQSCVFMFFEKLSTCSQSFFFFLKKGSLPHKVPHLDASVVSEAWAVCDPLQWPLRACLEVSPRVQLLRLPGPENHPPLSGKANITSELSP